MKKILIFSLMTILIIINGQFVYADDATNSDKITVTKPEYYNISIDEDLKVRLGSTWANIGVVVQILAIGCVVFAGVRYMFTSAEQKADVKNGLINLVIGSVLVFLTVPIIRFAAHTTTQIIDPTLVTQQEIEEDSEGVKWLVKVIGKWDWFLDSLFVIKDTGITDTGIKDSPIGESISEAGVGISNWYKQIIAIRAISEDISNGILNGVPIVENAESTNESDEKNDNRLIAFFEELFKQK